MIWTGWAQTIETIGGTTVVVAAIAWIARSSIGHFFSRELEKFKIDVQAEHARQLEGLKHQQAKELESLRASQQEALADMRAQAEERLTHLKAALDRVASLEADLLKSRGKSYGEIWQLTGSLNLFGPATKVDAKDLSVRLKEWYFEHGWVLTQESKRRYFLVQEVLNFAMLQSLPFKRPADQELYGNKARPVEILRELRSKLLQVPDRNDEGNYQLNELESYVVVWKTEAVGKKRHEEPTEAAWVLLQFVLSAFRSGITEELGSREMVQAGSTRHA